MDDLFDAAYRDNGLTQVMIMALRDEVVRNWGTAIKKQLRIAYVDCQLVGARI